MTRYRVNAACRFLLRAFAPGCPTKLRCWSQRRVRAGEQVTIVYDLADDDARSRVADLVRTAPTLRQIAIGPRVIRDLEGRVDGDTLTVVAMLVRA